MKNSLWGTLSYQDTDGGEVCMFAQSLEKEDAKATASERRIE